MKKTETKIHSTKDPARLFEVLNRRAYYPEINAQTNLLAVGAARLAVDWTSVYDVLYACMQVVHIPIVPGSYM